MPSKFAFSTGRGGPGSGGGGSKIAFSTGRRGPGSGGGGDSSGGGHGVLGKCKWFSRERGYGFIVPEDGSEDVFVNIKDVEGKKYLKNGAPVQYLLTEGRSGELDRAVGVNFAVRNPASKQKFSFHTKRRGGGGGGGGQDIGRGKKRQRRETWTGQPLTVEFDRNDMQSQNPSPWLDSFVCADLGRKQANRNFAEENDDNHRSRRRRNYDDYNDNDNDNGSDHADADDDGYRPPREGHDHHDHHDHGEEWPVKVEPGTVEHPIVVENVPIKQEPVSADSYWDGRDKPRTRSRSPSRERERSLSDDDEYSRDRSRKPRGDRNRGRDRGRDRDSARGERREYSRDRHSEGNRRQVELF